MFTLLLFHMWDFGHFDPYTASVRSVHLIEPTQSTIRHMKLCVQLGLTLEVQSTKPNNLDRGQQVISHQSTKFGLVKKKKRWGGLKEETVPVKNQQQPIQPKGLYKSEDFQVKGVSIKTDIVQHHCEKTPIDT